jgi:uncharacterized membrane protein (UPF0127 family)
MVMVEVADTAAARERGLSGHAPLKEQEGMLFVFESDEHWGIWMKDMHFAIDIVWADAQGKILTIAERAAPETYPQTFSPTAPARYVLELPAGFVERHGIAEGDQIVI